MVKLNNTFTSFWDVDDTLAMWIYPEDVYKHPNVTYINCSLFNEPIPVIIHNKHVQQLISQKLRGFVNVVWSYGGADWAEAIVKALNIENYVDVVCCKPDVVYDDLQKEEILLKRSYIPFMDKK